MSELPLPERLPFGSVEKLSTGWWGVVCLVTTEACLFGYLIFSYAFTAVNGGQGALPARPPDLTLALPNTFLLLASSVAVWWGERGLKAKGDRRRLLIGYGAGFLMGLGFVLVQLAEWREKTFSFSTNAYASAFFTITGFHMSHVLAGLLGLGAILVWNLAGYFDRERNAPITYVSIYWHFVDAVWIVVFSTFYIAPRLG